MTALKHLTRQPLFWLIAHRDVSAFGRLPLNDRPLHQAGVGKHKRFGGGGAGHAGLRFRAELAPTGAFAVDHSFPAKRFHPVAEFFFGQALFFEIVENILKTLFGQPGSGFFDGIAVGDAVNGDGGVFHDVL